MAESAINYPYLRNYSREFAGMISGESYRENKRLSGREILELTPIRQVNLLIIRDLYDAWQKEMESIQSPFFDYSSPAVKDAMNHLRNTLSNNISIERPVLEPMLAQAVERTLILIFSPYEFFISLFSPDKGKKIRTTDLKSAKKYIKVNTRLYDAFLNRLAKENISEGTGDLFTNLFDEVCGSTGDTPDDPEPFINQFGKTLALDVNKVYHAKAGAERTRGPEKSPDQPVEKKTLLDEYQEAKTDTIAEFLKRKTVESIRKSITINQKFMFVRELFDEDENLFTRSINELDGLENMTQAAQYLENNFFSNSRWDRENEAVMEFLEVLQKKFS